MSVSATRATRLSWRPTPVRPTIRPGRARTPASRPSAPTASGAHPSPWSSRTGTLATPWATSPSSARKRRGRPTGRSSSRTGRLTSAALTVSTAFATTTATGTGARATPPCFSAWADAPLRCWATAWQAGSALQMLTLAVSTASPRRRGAPRVTTPRPAAALGRGPGQCARCGWPASLIAACRRPANRSLATRLSCARRPSSGPRSAQATSPRAAAPKRGREVARPSSCEAQAASTGCKAVPNPEQRCMGQVCARTCVLRPSRAHRHACLRAGVHAQAAIARPAGDRCLGGHLRGADGARMTILNFKPRVACQLGCPLF
mmetsp:Transcript_84041/g.265311  ORF Transcript_84041/g.265311 Transcript_84041/m.265311 type:complete len:319 (-) Transcript_84041:79-1035(-)